MICSMGNHLGAPTGLYLCPWGAFGRAPPCLARDTPWERSKLGFRKISQIFLIRSLFFASAISPTSGLQTMQIRCPGCVPRNYLQLRYSFLSLKMKIRSPNRPWKIICSDFRLTAQQGFRGLYLLAHLSELGLPHVQIEGIVEAHNFGSQTFAIKDRLSLRICTERSCCPELREYLSGRVDLVGKHPNPRSFAC
jgi:hypothetical protein